MSQCTKCELWQLHLPWEKSQYLCSTINCSLQFGNHSYVRCTWVQNEDRLLLSVYVPKDYHFRYGMISCSRCSHGVSTSDTFRGNDRFAILLIALKAGGSVLHARARLCWQKRHHRSRCMNLCKVWTLFLRLKGSQSKSCRLNAVATATSGIAPYTTGMW